MFIPAVCIAAVYGAVHDQISYTVSNEYYTRFKFIQFSMPPFITEAQAFHRLGAAFVGVLATWWMGAVLFAVLGLFGFMFPSARIMRLELLKSFAIVIIIAFVTALLGLVYGYLQVDENTVSNYSRWIWSDVSEPVQFVRVGVMHNASYLGGLIGLIAGIIYLLLARKMYRKNLKT